MTPILALTLGLTVTAPAAPPSPAETLKEAADVLAEMRELRIKGIPPSLVADAHAVVVIPSAVKAGFLVAVQGGHGVVLTRTPTGTWCEPTFVTLEGGGVGFQAGVEATDLVLVFKTRKGLERVLEGKGQLTLGAAAGVAAGPIGRQAEAGTDGRMRAEILSYSRARGVFVGAALEGAALRYDVSANRAYRAAPQWHAPAVDQLKARLNDLATEALPPPAPARPE